MKKQIEVRNPIVVALDVDTAGEALELARRLRGTVGMFKVGKQLFTASGQSVVRELLAMGEKVFLDLKFPICVKAQCPVHVQIHEFLLAFRAAFQFYVPHFTLLQHGAHEVD